MSSKESQSSNNQVAISIQGVCKEFQIYDKPHHRLLQGLFRGRKQYYEGFTALSNISFEVNKGEVVGITGRNGSGKSTLLQIICGTMTASSGTIETTGRIAALLELGTGFNPEFTGRENVFLNAAILGLTQDETLARLPSILDFAEIGPFIDQATKTYSSGMLLRLAFAISINVDPEILIIDEALSVGDERFQRKCFSRIEEIKKQGATILFVSHTASTIIELCDRALLIDRGELLAVGLPKKIVGNYQRLLYAPPEKVEEVRKEISQRSTLEITKKSSNSSTNNNKSLASEESLETFDPSLVPKSTISYEEQGAKINSPRILTLDGQQVNNLVRGREYRYVYQVSFNKAAQGVNFGMAIKGIKGTMLGGAASSPLSKNSIDNVSEGSRYEVEFRFRCRLNPAVYFLNAGVLGNKDGEQIYLHRLLDVAMFRVLPEADLLSTGLVDFEAQSTFKIHF